MITLDRPHVVYETSLHLRIQHLLVHLAFPRPQESVLLLHVQNLPLQGPLVLLSNGQSHFGPVEVLGQLVVDLLVGVAGHLEERD